MVLPNAAGPVPGLPNAQLQPTPQGGALPSAGQPRPGDEGVNPFFWGQYRAPTAAQSAAAQARQADIRQNGGMFQGRFNQPGQFANYAQGLGLDPNNINAGNFYSTYQTARDQGLSPSRREFSRGAGQALPGLMDVRGDVGGHSLWKYLRGAGTGASAAGYGDWLGQKDQPDAAKPLARGRGGGGYTV